MVPVGTLEDLAVEAVPVQVEPALPGTWRWLGTKTLTFQYDSALIDRLPKATEYRVTVPAGTRSVTGGVLPETVSWTFTTPPPKLVTSYPQDIPQPLEPIFFIAFDQRIDPAAVLSTIQVNAGGAPVQLQLASQEAVQADKAVSRLVEQATEGRWLTFGRLNPCQPTRRLGDGRTGHTLRGGTPGHLRAAELWLPDVRTTARRGVPLLLVGRTLPALRTLLHPFQQSNRRRKLP
jgi:hypothetical protein